MALKRVVGDSGPWGGWADSPTLSGQIAPRGPLGQAIWASQFGPCAPKYRKDSVIDEVGLSLPDPKLHWCFKVFAQINSKCSGVSSCLGESRRSRKYVTQLKNCQLVAQRIALFTC